MIPATIITTPCSEIYLHGVPHPTSLVSLRPEYVQSVGEYLSQDISAGKFWCCEDGLQAAFLLTGVTQIPYLAQFVLPIVREMTQAELEAKAGEALSSMSAIKKSEREMFAEGMASISELPTYRQMFYLPDDALESVAMHKQGIKPKTYAKLIERCQHEYDQLVAMDQPEIHFLCGIAHEFIIERLHSDNSI